MGITDKTRKLLWARSGSRCAICRCELIHDEPSIGKHSIVGEECHIASRQPGGPRYDPDIANEAIDSEDNLLLLCACHHKMVDELVEKYTIEGLRQLKSDHQDWVTSSLGTTSSHPQVRIRRMSAALPQVLPRLYTGRDMFAIVSCAMAWSMEHDELESEQEAEVVAQLFEEIGDSDIVADLGGGEKVRASMRMKQLLTELSELGLQVFGGVEVQAMDGGIGPPMEFPVAIVRVLRDNSPAIVSVPLDGDEEKKGDSASGAA